MNLTRLRSVGLALVGFVSMYTAIFPIDLRAQSYLSATGSPSFSAAYPIEMGAVDTATGNLHIEIPLGSFPQRGGSTTQLSLAYDSHIWAVQPAGAPYWIPQNAPVELLSGGWYVAVAGAWLAPTMLDFGACTWDQVVWAPNGTQHWFNINLGSGTLSSGCSLSSTNTYAIDSSGFELFVTYQNNPNDYLNFTLYAPDGTLVMQQEPGTNNSFDYPKDTNGNYMQGPFGGAGSGSDTLGRQFLVLPISPPSCEFTSVHPGGQYYACYQVYNSQGSTSQYTLSFADIPLSTNFGWSGVTECTTNCWTTVVTGVTLPDGTSYSFKYDCDSTTGNSACNSPGSQSGYYGTLTEMTLPTSEQITYGYSMFGGVSWGNNQSQYPSRWVTSKTSSTTGSWAYTPTATAGAGPGNTCLPNYLVGCMQVYVTRPDASADSESFIVDPVGGSYLQSVLSYDTDGTLLSTVSNTYDFSTKCSLAFCLGDFLGGAPEYYGYEDVRKLTALTTVTVPGGSITKQTTYSYDSPQTGNITAVKEWKYQPGTSPTFSSVPDRATYMTYATIAGTNDINRPSVINICNNIGTDSKCAGGGSTVARTIITYDGYGGTSGNCLKGLTSITGVVNHDDVNYGCSYTARGNATQIARWASGSSATLVTNLTYDTTGQVLSTVDPAGNVTSYAYQPDNFYTDNGSDPPATYSPSQPTNAYVVKVIDKIGATTAGYYYWTGKTALSTDYDSQYTYLHFVDPFDRLTNTEYPIGWALNQYQLPIDGLTEVDSYAPVGFTGGPTTSCTSCTHSQSILDQLGRVTSDRLVNNPAGEVYVDYTYDSLNRVVSTTHPNFGSGDPNDVTESQQYDGFSRSIQMTHPDTQTSKAAYGSKVGELGGVTTQLGSGATYGYGFPIVSLDEDGKQKQEWLDGFGKVIEVDELIYGSATPGTGSLSVDFDPTQESNTFTVCSVKKRNSCQQETVYNSGQITVTVNGFMASTPYGPPPPVGPYTPEYIASALAGALNVAGSPVTAVANSSTVTLTSIAAGSDTNYSVSLSATYDSTGLCPTEPCFSGPSYYASGLSGLSGGTGGSTSPVATNYIYDDLGNLTGVSQGAQTRSWSYDGLSRMTQEITPEGGTITFSYLNSSGKVCSGDPSKPCSKIAPTPNQSTGTVTTTYSYDTANRLTSRCYSDSSACVTFTYNTASQGIGLLKTMTDPSGSESYAYDKMKRITGISKTIGLAQYSIVYGYNTAGQLTSLTYPSGRKVYYNYDQVGHLCQIATSTSASCSAGTYYVSIPSTQYDAANRPLGATYGNGVVASTQYDPVGFGLTSLTYTKGTTTLFGLKYYYQQDSTNCPSGPAHNNGQIQCIIDTVQSGRSVAYTYDSLGRLLTAVTAGSNQYPAWGLSETYDRYGNRTAQAVTTGSGYNVSLSINPATNQVTTFSYDGAGNITSEPSPTVTFSYDHDECNTGYSGSVSSATYTCDGNGLRVQKVVSGTGAVTTVYIRSGGQVLAEYDSGMGVTSPSREYLYGNNLLATVTGSTGGSGGTITYQHRDHLSPRLFTDSNGNDIGEQGTYPFGESWYSGNGAQGFIFTTYERDAESSDDYALARSYASLQGRFTTPDPLEGIVGDAQSWNRYAYVENDPINLSDPSGQGFWADLGLAIASIFVDALCQACIPAMSAVDEAAAGAQATDELGRLLVTIGTIGGVAVHCGIGNCINMTFPKSTPAPGSGGNEQGGGSAAGGNPAPQSGGGPGAGTAQDTGASGQSSTGGGATATGSNSAPSSGGAPVGGRVWNELDYHIVSNPGYAAQPGAQFIYWTLKNKSPHGGTIVQHVTFHQVAGRNIDYWEAWSVEPGTNHTTIASTYRYDDAFSDPKGSTVNAYARFYEGLKLPKTFVVGAVPYAGDLPSTYRNPHLSTVHATPAVHRFYVAP